MGTPSATQPWGWQLDGYHANINYFILGDQVVMSPAFLGSKQVVAESGQYAGTRILEQEQQAGLDFVNGLSEAQRNAAILERDKDGNNNVAEAFNDNLDLDSTGIAGEAMSAEQQQRLLALIGLYVGNLRDGHAQIRMDEVEQHLDATRAAGPPRLPLQHHHQLAPLLAAVVQLGEQLGHRRAVLLVVEQLHQRRARRSVSGLHRQHLAIALDG